MAHPRALRYFRRYLDTIFPGDGKTVIELTAKSPGLVPLDFSLGDWTKDLIYINNRLKNFS